MNLKLIKEQIISARSTTINIEDRFHHNTSYSSIEMILKHGIVSLKNKSILENKPLTQEQLQIYDEDGHVNGVDYISLSCMDMNYVKPYKDEFIYEAFNPRYIDIVISNEVKVIRNSNNYANEFLAKETIGQDLMKSIDIRILNLIGNKKSELEIIEYYNYLIKAARLIKKLKLNILIREMSYDNITLNPQILSNKQIVKVR